jgi:hypothetical protein
MLERVDLVVFAIGAGAITLWTLALAWMLWI